MNPAAFPPSRMPDLPRTRAHLEQGLRDRLWTGYSLAVRRRGKALESAGGDVPSPSATVPWFSAGKPITAVGVLRILESNPSLASELLSATLPELIGTYAGGRKLPDILSHQTGLRISENHLRGSDSEILESFRNVTPADFNLSAGQASYDPAGGWWLLGQWITRLSGMPWQKFLGEKVLHPAGLTGLGFGKAEIPIRDRRAGKWVEGEPGTGPGGGLVGSPAQLARFYEKLVQGQLLQSSSLKKMLSPARRDQLDATFGHVIDFGLGVILNRNRHGADTVPYGFGAMAGDRAFGHGGARSSVAFADPDHAFTAAIFLNGRVPETEHQPRMRTILDLLRSELVSG
jgi:CubicO group peptidase (beta-lactamase class C family)